MSCFCSCTIKPWTGNPCEQPAQTKGQLPSGLNHQKLSEGGWEQGTACCKDFVCTFEQGISAGEFSLTTKLPSCTQTHGTFCNRHFKIYIKLEFFSVGPVSLPIAGFGSWIGTGRLPLCLGLVVASALCCLNPSKLAALLTSWVRKMPRAFLIRAGSRKTSQEGIRLCSFTGKPCFLWIFFLCN